MNDIIKHNFTLIGNVSTLEITLTNQCSKDYYGSNCQTYCKADPQQYNCSDDGRKIYRNTTKTTFIATRIIPSSVAHLTTLHSLFISSEIPVVSSVFSTPIIHTYGSPSITATQHIPTSSAVTNSSIHTPTSTYLFKSETSFFSASLKTQTKFRLSSSIYLFTALTKCITPTKVPILYTSITTASPAVHSSVVHMNATSPGERKSGKWLTSTVGGITTICLIVVLCLAAIALFVRLHLNDK